MKNNIKKDCQYIEQWALSMINENWIIENSIQNNESELCEQVMKDLAVTYPLCIFRTLPNYARLLVIEALNWHEALSMDNVHYVESELRHRDEVSESHDWFIAVTVREIKQKKKTDFNTNKTTKGGSNE